MLDVFVKADEEIWAGAKYLESNRISNGDNVDTTVAKVVDVGIPFECLTPYAFWLRIWRIVVKDTIPITVGISHVHRVRLVVPCQRRRTSDRHETLLETCSEDTGCL